MRRGEVGAVPPGEQAGGGPLGARNRCDDEGDVVAHLYSVDDRSLEVRRALVEHRGAGGPRVPRSAGELVDGVPGQLGEERCHVVLTGAEEVEGERARLERDSERVVLQ